MFSGIGIYAIRRKKPMWFWSDSTVPEDTISDVAAYNRANGIMWLWYSAAFWIAGFLGIASPVAGVIVLGAACTIGLPVLVVVYRKILREYSV